MKKRQAHRRHPAVAWGLLLLLLVLPTVACNGSTPEREPTILQLVERFCVGSVSNGKQLVYVRLAGWCASYTGRKLAGISVCMGAGTKQSNKC